MVHTNNKRCLSDSGIANVGKEIQDARYRSPSLPPPSPELRSRLTARYRRRSRPPPPSLLPPSPPPPGLRLPSRRQPDLGGAVAPGVSHLVRQDGPVRLRAEVDEEVGVEF